MNINSNHNKRNIENITLRNFVLQFKTNGLKQLISLNDNEVKQATKITKSKRNSVLNLTDFLLSGWIKKHDKLNKNRIDDSSQSRPITIYEDNDEIILFEENLNFNLIKETNSFKNPFEDLSYKHDTNWKRVNDFIDKLEFYKNENDNNINSDNYQQLFDLNNLYSHSLINIYNNEFFRAVLRLSLDFDLFKHVIQFDNKFSTYTGAFRFNFWRNGNWYEVIIDDYLPIRRYNSTHIWYYLLEKAYAKFCSCSLLDFTENFKSSSDILIELTGGINDTYFLKDYYRKNTDYLWNKLIKARMKKLIIECYLNKHKEDFSSRYLPHKHGIIKGRCYFITKIAELDIDGKDFQLIQLKKTWNDKNNIDWFGDWSKDSFKWRTISPTISEALNNNLKNGEFWMSFNDWLSHFDTCSILNIVHDTNINSSRNPNFLWYAQNFHVECNVTSIGLNLEKFHLKPQIKFNFSEKDLSNNSTCDIIITATSKNDAKKIPKFSLYKIENDKEILVGTGEKSEFSDHVKKHFNLNSTGLYAIVPCIEPKNTFGELMIRIISEKPMSKGDIEFIKLKATTHTSE